jgi:hypothetical protein
LRRGHIESQRVANDAPRGIRLLVGTMTTPHSTRKKVLDLLVEVDRAHKHLSDFQLEVNRFFRPPYPYEIIPEDDAQKGERTYYLRVHKEIPPEFSAFIGDIAQLSAGRRSPAHRKACCPARQSPAGKGEVELRDEGDQYIMAQSVAEWTGDQVAEAARQASRAATALADALRRA